MRMNLCSKQERAAIAKKRDPTVESEVVTETVVAKKLHKMKQTGIKRYLEDGKGNNDKDKELSDKEREGIGTVRSVQSLRGANPKPGIRPKARGGRTPKPLRHHSAVGGDQGGDGEKEKVLGPLERWLGVVSKGKGPDKAKPGSGWGRTELGTAARNKEERKDPNEYGNMESQEKVDTKEKTRFEDTTS